jgi:hypothetical protein
VGAHAFGERTLAGGRIGRSGIEEAHGRDILWRRAS